MAYPSRVSKDQILEMIQKKKQGASVHELSEEYGLSTKTIYNYMAGYKTTKRKPGKKYPKKQEFDTAAYLGQTSHSKPMVALIGTRTEIASTLKELFS